MYGVPLRGHLQGKTRDYSNTHFFHTKKEHIYMCCYIISVVYIYIWRIISCLKGFTLFYHIPHIWNACLYYRLLTHVHCKPTHVFFQMFMVPMFSLNSSSRVMKDWPDKYHEWNTPTRSPSRSTSRKPKHAFSTLFKGT